MKKSDFKMTDQHRKDLARRTAILILSVCLVSYLFKILGSTTFNKFITNETFIQISNVIDHTYWLNILCYGVLGYIMTQCAFWISCRTFKIKWFEYLGIFIFALIWSVLRYHYMGAITYVFDVLQYILIPTLYGLIRKNSTLDNLMYTLIHYFMYNGIVLVNITLCDLKAIMYASNFIAYVLSLIEVYLFLITYAIFIINGGFKNVKSSINSK